MDACAMPRACPATPMRPPSKVVIAILKPSPTLPRSADLGTRTFSRMRLAVEDARMPSLSSLAPKLKPGRSVGTMNALTPLCLRLRSVVAKTMAQLASCAFVIHAFVLLAPGGRRGERTASARSCVQGCVPRAPCSTHPFSTQSPPSSLAVVVAAPASEPFPGSDSPKQPTLAPCAYSARNSSFCSGVPYFSTGAQYSELWADMMTPVEAQPREISSIATA
mmetsp:Transcript_16380/g.42439  ORF Transcript_16380/g.42439 Transcript_16380/m.42439 type:complete len:221 (-) Transcript_16380:310-972(-)